MKNNSITIIRVFAMIGIFLTHLLTCYGINDYQLLAVGVEIFLIISGFLYSNKEIDVIPFLKNRTLKILLPIWIFSLCLSLIFALLGGDIFLAITSFAETIINIEGLHSIVLFSFPLGSNHLAGVSHLWFITVLFCCYFLMIFIKKTNFESVILKYPYVALLLSILCQIGLAYIGIQIAYFVCYFIGYFYGKLDKATPKKINLIASIFMIAVSLLVRLMFKFLIDESILYNRIISVLSWVGFGFGLFVCEKCFLDYFPKFSNRVANSLCFKFLNYVSLSLYISHYCFMQGDFNITVLIENRLVSLFLIIMLSVFSALMLAVVTSIVNRKLIKRLK